MRMVIALVIALNWVPSEVTTIKCVTNSSEFDCHPETGQSIAFKHLKMSAIVAQLFIVSWAIGTKQHQCTNKRSRRITSVYPSDIRRIQGWGWNPYLAKQSSSLVRTTDQSHIECGEIATKLVEVVYGPYGSTPISSCCSFGLSIMHLRNRALGARWEIIWSYLLANNKEKQVKFGSNQLVGYEDGFNELLQWSKLFLVN